jgi:hypothetical protein
MNKTILVVLLAALIPASAFAVDGQVLINNSTVMAQGGYPYVISTPGSYKLSGSLTAPLNTYAVKVLVNNVSLDLNGFSVQCSSNGSGPVMACIGAPFGTSLHDVTVRNGSVSASSVGSPPAFYGLSGVDFSSSSVILESLQVRVIADNLDVLGTAAAWGTNAIIKGNIFVSNIPPGLSAQCPSVVVNNINSTGAISSLSAFGCAVSANVGIL